MAGRTPAEAVRSFLEPLQQALACVATGMINLSGDGHSPRLGVEYAWSINNGGGAELLSAEPELQLYAGMRWELIEDDRPDYGPYRIRTLAYDYSLVREDGSELWALHWYPVGRSWETRPHVHLGNVLLAEDAPISNKSHLRTGRMTFEDAIRWAIEFGAEPLHDDWQDRLALAEAPHILHRTWSTVPP